ncbi:MAG: hypothetical protein V3581_02120 [Candidatus Cardinium sp.]|nr:hypothetical protein [Candidatus Cardinium sp. TP]MDN5246911.1 hypothetical protein [Candidatus Cardinium sp.]
MNIKNIIGTIEPSDIARAEQQVLIMETEHQDTKFNMLAFAE